MATHTRDLEVRLMTPLVIVSSFIATSWCIRKRTGKSWGASILWTLLLTMAIVVLVGTAFMLLD